MSRDEMIYNHILDELLVYFAKGSYHGKTNKDLQDDFKEFTSSHRRFYREILDSILEGVTDYELETWRTFKLDWKRLKICSICGEPFYSLDKMNRNVTCYKNTYMRYKKDGTPYGSNGKSECYMARKRKYV